MKNLGTEMNKLVKFADECLRVGAPDPHLYACVETADKFHLWEIDSNGAKFPIWLSYVVQGIGRDNGILD